MSDLINAVPVWLRVADAIPGLDEIAGPVTGVLLGIAAIKMLSARNDSHAQLKDQAQSTTCDCDKNIKVVVISQKLYPETAEHMLEAQAEGYPSLLTVNRAGARANRAASLKGYAKVPGKQLDEYPPAMFVQGGAGASIKAIDPADNMGAGASMGNQLRGAPDGSQVLLEVGP